MIILNHEHGTWYATHNTTGVFGSGTTSIEALASLKGALISRIELLRQRYDNLDEYYQKQYHYLKDTVMGFVEEC